MATALSTPFYLDLGFSMTEIGLVAKNAGLWSGIVGGLLGGVLMIKIGINRALWVFGAVQLFAYTDAPFLRLEDFTVIVRKFLKLRA